MIFLSCYTTESTLQFKVGLQPDHFDFKKGDFFMLKMVIFKKRMWFGLCMLLIGLMMAPGLVVGLDKVNINTADKEMLSSLPGVGPVIADRIIENREKNGPFKNNEEITKIKGIGEKTFQKIKDLITVE